MDGNRTQGWVRHQPCVRNYRHISSSINSDCGHWIVFYRARYLYSARRKTKQRKRMGFACQPRVVPRSCLFIIIWGNTTHDTQVRAAWPLCTTNTFGHTRRHGGKRTGVIYILGVDNVCASVIPSCHKLLIQRKTRTISDFSSCGATSFARKPTTRRN